jgi:phospholipid-binding lipoprotein MlaA
MIGFLLVTGLSACATAPQDPVEREIYEEANDPAQPLNEAIFEFNLALDKAIIRPIAYVFDAVFPTLVKDSVRNFVRHLRTPVILANNLMQGEVEHAGDTLGRFIFNTVAGLGGVFDPAGEAGIAFKDEDFGQTLAIWGIEEGPYMMLPFLGPSNGRDLTGFVVDAGLDPLLWAGYNSERSVVENNVVIRSAAQIIDGRSRNVEQLEDLEETSLDFYATLRSLYRQQRNDLIHNGEADDLPDIGFESYDDADSATD